MSRAHSNCKFLNVWLARDQLKNWVVAVMASNQLRATRASEEWVEYISFGDINGILAHLGMSAVCSSRK